ncbi:DUF2797 domain-containing protein [Micromonospora sp. NBC_01813]|uniref:DUF2797 domain-containing protein n=1 Tax=Micromonospora sp. NBC_01813 TaxID=2975988 RepID=UPI002DD934C7|nr:DUF2797 domain-containing protein [Micromonospora sp. NBC_01813]WSA06859.1 DUF2797 domain-containing protein [Micromonospora sp. NBC_01813]
MDRETSIGYTCHGVTWATGKPTLLLANASAHRLEHVEIVGRALGFRATKAARYCTGRYRFVGTYKVEPLPCPRQAEAAVGDQCASCSAQDEFRLAHRFHHGGYVPDSLHAYMAQPHFLYLATFAHAVSKVGTAARPRKSSRLNEQGPIRATYLAEVADGRTVRHLEDSLSAHLGVAQTIRAAAKVAALVTPDIEEAEAAHENLLARAVAHLADLRQTPINEAWSPPVASQKLTTPPGQHQRVSYPHDLREGKHGFYIESCLGTAVLVRLTPEPDPDPTRYVVDLNALRGAHVDLGNFSSPPTPTQAALF